MYLVFVFYVGSKGTVYLVLMLLEGINLLADVAVGNDVDSQATGPPSPKTVA